MNQTTTEPTPKSPNEAAKERLAVAEKTYAGKVLELDVLLRPYYQDPEVRRTIAECSDIARELYRGVLAFRTKNSAPGSSIGIGLIRASLDNLPEAPNSPTGGDKGETDTTPEDGNETILQRNSTDLQRGSAVKAAQPKTF